MPWGDEERTFRLGIKQLLTLEENCRAGVSEILARLMGNRWTIKDVQEPLRLGLIGAGMDIVDAKGLVDRYAGPGNLYASLLASVKVLGDAVQAPEGEEVPGKDQAAETNPDDSPLPQSSEPELS